MVIIISINILINIIKFKKNINRIILITNSNYIGVNYIYYITKKYPCKLLKEKAQASLFRKPLFLTKKEKIKSSIIKKIEIRDQIINNV